MFAPLLEELRTPSEPAPLAQLDTTTLGAHIFATGEDLQLSACSTMRGPHACGSSGHETLSHKNEN